ncbi:MAG: diacylglycerol kinase family protein [Saprospiraceae bacterium]
MNFQKFIASFSFAFKGVFTLFKEEQNAKFHLTASIFVLLSAWYFHIEIYEWLACIICIVMVFAAEGFNTALEKLTDLVSPDIHPLAGKVKDLAAGAVLMVSIGALAVGLLIFLPKFLKLLF